VKRFYPTRLAIQLANGIDNDSNEDSKSNNKGYIIVETNYRIYAYTSQICHSFIIYLLNQLII
jgi:transcription initiation factor TFIIH subunit 4